MNNEQVPLADTELPKGIISLLGAGDVICDQCGEIINHLERYCWNTHECPICRTTFDNMQELDTHFSEQHPEQLSRGTRYCIDCSLKQGYLKMVKSKKTGEIFPAMFALRDEEVVEDSQPSG